MLRDDDARVKERAIRRLGVDQVVAILGGAMLTLVVWVAIVPWDLSEVDARGRPTGTGGDDLSVQIGVALVVVAAAGLLTAVVYKREWTIYFSAGSSAMWAVLFAWRASVSRVSGANLWPVPFVMFVLPLAVLVPVAVRAVMVRARRRSE